MIWMKTSDGKQYPIISIETIPNFIEEGGPHYFQIGDVKVDHCSERTLYGSIHIVYLEEFKEELQNALLDHVYSMFRDSPVFQLKTSLDRKLPILTGIQDIHLSGSRFEGPEEKLESFLSTYPNLNSIHIRFELNSLKDTSKFFEIPNICCQETNLMTSNVLENFKGRVAIFWNATCDSNVLRVFLLKWIRNEAYQNLKVLRIDHSWYELIPLDILGNIQRKQWDPKQRPRFFKYKLPIMEYRKTINQNCSTWIDIEREQDKKLVSVRIQPRQFLFYVWN
ncbi:unnamed protein product [Caenorhabditis brenneri]